MAESEYLRLAVGEPLSRCLADVVLHRPKDPIEYIALWLYKHDANVRNEIQLAKEREQLAKEIEEQKLAKELMIQLALEEELQHKKEQEQMAEQLEEAQRLQVYHTDIAEKYGTVPAVHSAASVQHATMPEDATKQEKEETGSPEQEHTSQTVLDSEVEEDQQEEFQDSLNNSKTDVK